MRTIISATYHLIFVCFGAARVGVKQQPPLTGACNLVVYVDIFIHESFYLSILKFIFYQADCISHIM